ncbi:hypothetical protein P5673_010689 [Acropora cervicornis]|uniref:Uncharacterized protein n=1 Tax=Acropora cervicornis TaxID=6130 RepID=A0AAD9V9C2_ACRCE|nr:hypothetical protein P5673_010689 [Acropora cervicornis]
MILDSGATGNMIRNSLVTRLGGQPSPSSQSAHQADGCSPLKVVGETRLSFTRTNREFSFEGLVVENLDVNVLAGTPFTETNDISICPAKRQVTIGDGRTYAYGSQAPAVTSTTARKIRIPNLSSEAHSLKRNNHFCQVNPVFSPAINIATSSTPCCEPCPRPSGPTGDLQHNSSVRLDPENALPPDIRAKFQELHVYYDEVFDPRIKGMERAATQYARNKLVELQEKFDQLEELGVFKHPEDIGISIEYLNPSFLVKKQSGGYRLITAFADVGRYSKPQPSVMPDVDSTLRHIAQWKHLMSTFQALEELMCRVLGHLLQEGIVVKITDDLYTSGNTSYELLENWKKVLQAFCQCDLRLSASKTAVNPTSTIILGWIGGLEPYRPAHIASQPWPPVQHQRQ